MPHYYSSFWLAFGNGATLSPIWAWRDRAGALPSWAPAFLAALEASGCATAASEGSGHRLLALATVRALQPGLRRAWDAALARHAAAQLPSGQPEHESPIGESGADADSRLSHPLEVLAMGQWLKLSETERADIVEQYAKQRPRLAVMAGDVRKRGER